LMAPVAAPFAAATTTSPTIFFALFKIPFAVLLLADFYFEPLPAFLVDFEEAFEDLEDFEVLFFVVFFAAMCPPVC